MSSIHQYLDLYREHRALIEAGSCTVMNAVRPQVAEHLTAAVLPDKRVERYKYTDAEAAFAPDFGINLHRFLAVKDPYKDYHCSVPEMSTLVIYVVNDVVAPLRNPHLVPEGVTICSLREAQARCPELLERYYHRAAAAEPANAHKHTDRTERDAITLLNTLLAQDGLFIHFAPGVQFDRTLQIVFLATGRNPMMSNRRLLVVAEEGASANLLLCEHADAQPGHLTTQVTEIFAAACARIDCYTLEETQADHTRFSNVYVEQQTDSRVGLHSIALTTGRSRTMTNVRLLGAGADCQTSGAVIADAQQQVDNNLLIDHVAEGCTSDMLYKYVLDGKSEAAWAGKVLVRPGAQQTLSHQSSANLCLSPAARVHSLPMLEIYADDVKCNHGSTVGRLDEAALLYLRQRGIPEPEAKLLLQHAFVNDVLQRIKIDHLRERLSHLVELRFRGELRHCKGCRHQC